MYRKQNHKMEDAINFLEDFLASHDVHFNFDALSESSNQIFLTLNREVFTQIINEITHIWKKTLLIRFIPIMIL